MQTMHLFAGVGGGLLADLILGHEPIAAVEWDPYCCQVLRERADEGWFPELHVWEGDVRLFDSSEYAGRVDCIHAGFPCQDISVAGKQAGVGEETRSGLYREVLRIAGVVRPQYLFLENVSAILSNGLGTVLGDLAEMGYDTRYCCLRASDVGAPHHRDRWWCLAYAKSKGTRQNDNRIWPRISRTCGGEKTTTSSLNALADAEREREQRIISQEPHAQKRQQPNERPDRSCGDGFGWWSVESNMGRVANGVPRRVDRIKGLGNAQVPLQAATAWKLLGGP